MMTQSRSENTVSEGFWPKLAQNLARLPFADDVAAAYFCAFDPATPLKVKGTLVGALAYFILPFDIVPDFLLGLGFTDDLAVLVTAISMVRGHIKPAHREQARQALDRIKTGETASNG
jgi:uncharacterized membrane protein YkvA (DUF1232 family)